MVTITGLRSISLKTSTAPSCGPVSPEEASAVSKSAWPAWPGVSFTRQATAIQSSVRRMAGAKNTPASPKPWRTRRLQS